MVDKRRRGKKYRGSEALHWMEGMQCNIAAAILNGTLDVRKLSAFPHCYNVGGIQHWDNVRGISH